MEVTLDFVKQLKQRILTSRYLAAKMANAEMHRLYFFFGKDVDEQFSKEKWGEKVLESIADQLQQEIPGLRCFSASNIRKMRLFYQAWKQSELICPSVTDKLTSELQPILPLVTDKKHDDSNKINP